jgi:hemoglobin/transferrin/lactoferrin receptor protein
LSRVEILRGPASALYGSDGLAGAVSFFTANPQDLLRRTGGDGYGSIATSYNQEDKSKSGTLAVAGRTGPVEIMAIVTERRASELDNFGTVGGEGVTRTQANPQEVQSSSLLAKWVYRFDANHRVTVTLDGLDSNTDTEALTARGPISFSSARAVDVDATDSVERKRASIQHSARQLSWGFASSLDWAIYGQDAKTRQLTNELRNNGQLRVRDQRYAERVLGLNTQLTKRFGDTVTHRLTYGVDAAWSTFVGNSDGTLPPFGERFPLKRFPDTDYNLVGAFIQDEIGFADDRVLIIPAIRYDRYSLKPEFNSAFVGVAAASKDSAVSPKLGLVYQLSEFALYANLAKGYKAPTPNQVNNGFTNQLSFYKTIANPDLQPETNTSIELGARKTRGEFTFDAAVFAGKYKDFIEQVQVSGNFTAANPAVFQFVNLSKVSLSGIEFKVGYSFESGVRLSAGYAQAKGEEQDTRQLSTNPAENTAQRFPLNSVQPAKLVAAVGWRSKGGDIGIDASAIHLFAKRADDAVPLTAPQVQFLPPAATTLDLNAFWRVSKSLSLSAGVRNVTDKKYWQWADVIGRATTSTDLDAFTQPGRAFSAAIRLEL